MRHGHICRTLAALLLSGGFPASAEPEVPLRFRTCRSRRLMANYDGQYIRHRSFLGFLTGAKSSSDEIDATFNTRAGPSWRRLVDFRIRVTATGATARGVKLTPQ